MKKYVLWGLASIGVISLWIFSVVAFFFIASEALISRAKAPELSSLAIE